MGICVSATGFRAESVARVTVAALLFVCVTSVFSTSLSAQESVQAGVSAAVHGEVQIARGDAVGRRIVSGEAVFLDDIISSGPESGMQILLLDETVFTIGPNSAMTIDTFVYDPDTGAGQVAANVVRGAFRFVSGQIAQEDPSQMTVGTPFGTIGIRGTIAGGIVGDTGAEIVLLGPGLNNNTQERPGAITVSNDLGAVEIERTGYSTILTPGLPPTIPAQSAPRTVRQIGGTEDGEGDEENESDNGSQDSADGPDADEATDDNSQTSDSASSDSSLDQASAQSGQGPAADFDTATEVGQTAGVFDSGSDAVADISTAQTGLGEVNSIAQMDTQLGQFHFVDTGTLTGSGGNAGYTITVDLDFTNRQIGGGNSGIVISTSDGSGLAGNFAILANGFDTVNGTQAVFDSQNNINYTCDNGGNTCTGAVTMSFRSFNETIAGAMEYTVESLDPDNERSSNGASATERFSGLSD